MIGTELGNYRIIEKIGDGGMGTVYLAEQESIGRRAALKVLHPHYFDDADIRERFFKEACAISQLKHPGVVELYDYGSDDKGYAFIVMEFLQGEDLSKRLRRLGGLPVGMSVHITRQIADALDSAHRAGIVHRDLKPDNLFLVRAVGIERIERVKILDFGVAKLLADKHSNLRQTQTGTVIGTPPYMSPEQCKGNAQVDHRADLYSLGCIMFRMMCGRTPFLSNGYGEMLAAHIHQPPPRPREIEPDIPPVFEAIILRLLEKEPARRFQSARELSAALDHAVATTHLGLPEPERSSGPYSGHPTPGGNVVNYPVSDWVMALRDSDLVPVAGTPAPGSSGNMLTPAHLVAYPQVEGTPQPHHNGQPYAAPGEHRPPDSRPHHRPSEPHYPPAEPAGHWHQPNPGAGYHQLPAPGHDGITPLSAAVDLPLVPGGTTKRRILGLLALAAIVCLASAGITLSVLQVGPFSGGEQLAVADTTPSSTMQGATASVGDRPIASSNGPEAGLQTDDESGSPAGDPDNSGNSGNGASGSGASDEGTENAGADDTEDAAGSSSDDSGSAAVEEPPLVTLTIESDPPGAEIYRKFDGVRIGVTPHELEVPAISGELVVLLKKDGFRDQEVAIASDRSSTQEVELDPVERRRPPRKRPPRQKPPRKKPPRDSKKTDDRPRPSKDDSPNPFK